MIKEKESFVWHLFCTLPEDTSLRFAEYINKCDGGLNNGPIFDGWLFTPGRNSPNDLMKVIGLVNKFVLDIDLNYVVKEFERPPFMDEILCLEKSNCEKSELIKRLERKVDAKDKQIAFLVFVKKLFRFFFL